MGITFKDIIPLIDSSSETLKLDGDAVQKLKSEHAEDAALIETVVDALSTAEEGAIFSASEIEKIQTLQDGVSFLKSFNSQEFQPQRFRFFAPKQSFIDTQQIYYGEIESYYIEANVNPQFSDLLKRPDFKNGLFILAKLPVNRFGTNYDLTCMSLWPKELLFSEMENLYEAIRQSGMHLDTMRLADLVEIGRYTGYRQMITDPEFIKWAKQIISKVDGSTNILIGLCHIYALGKESQHKALRGGFRNDFGIYNILQSLQYPITGTPNETYDFFVKHKHEVNQIFVGGAYSLLQQSSQIQQLYKQIEADPLFGGDRIFSQSPTSRLDFGAANVEPIEWKLLTTLNKLKALLMVEALTSDPQVIEMIASTIHEDAHNGRSELNGIFDVRIHEKTGAVTLVPEALRSEWGTDEGKYPQDPCMMYSFFQFHQNISMTDNHEEFRLSRIGDFERVVQRRTSSFVITAVGEETRDGILYQKFRVDLYGFNGNPDHSSKKFVLGLGVYEAAVSENFIVREAHQVVSR